jgi:lactaldehyde dehydrogenase/glycolaldehyde dehydrogenase
MDYQIFLGGRFASSQSDRMIDVVNPATGKVFARVPSASADEAAIAVELAAGAQKEWGARPAIERGDVLRRFADAIERNADTIAAALAGESGKSFADARAETGYGVDLMRYHAEWARRIEGEVIESDSRDETLLLKRVPIGVAACLIPFNFPVYTFVRKVAPALIAGNAVVVRPSNSTPTSAFAIAACAEEAGLPSGLLNVLTMDHDVARVMCTQPQVGMITLTGSVAAGQAVLDYCKVNIAKPSLELGGKTPVVVEPDADLDQVAAMLIGAKSYHCGQVCTSAERVYVHESVHDALVEKLTAAFKAREFGDRSVDPAKVGPLQTAASRIRVHAMVERATQEGATVAAGGYLPEGEGFFYPPTLLVNCRHEMEVVREEIFGPVLPVIAYSSFDEALRMMSDHQYGLASVLMTENYRNIMRASDVVEAGELYVNRFPGEPYQGYHAGWKRSGLGGDDGKHGMLEFTQTRLVILKH